MHTRSQSQRLAVAVSLLTVWIVWGSSYLAIAIAIETIPPFAMASVRFVAAGVLMLLVARARAVAWPRLRQWGAATVVGTLLLVGGNGLVTWAQLSVPSSIAALLITTVPLWMAVLDSVLYRGGRMRVRTGVGLVVGFAGVAVLVRPSGDELGALPLLGSVALLLASFSWANGSLLSRRLPLPPSPLMAVGAEMFTGGLVLGFIALVRGEAGSFDFAAVSGRSSVALLYLVLFGSIAALSAYHYLLRTISASAVSTYAFVNPIVAVALGWFVAAEPITPRVLIAAALIITAVVVILGSWQPRRGPGQRSRDRVTASVAAGAPVLRDGGEREVHPKA